MINLDYTDLIKLVQPYKVPGREEASSFLSWFLVKHFTGLKLLKLRVSFCDGRGDKGIDGIYINENEDCIDIFQSKTVQNSNKTLGDTQLKEFVGTLEQLQTAEGINSMLATTGNKQLHNLLIEYKDRLISLKYKIRGNLCYKCRQGLEC